MGMVAAMTRQRRRWIIAASAAAALVIVIGVYAVPRLGGGPLRAAVAAPALPGPQICGSPALNSPWSYTGAAGSYASGTVGLPTFGSAGTDFPGATAGLVIAAGNNTAAAAAGAYQLNSTVVYFEPGAHTIQGVMFAGHNSAYVGGYTPGAGAAVLDGVNGGTASGNGGSFLASEHASANNTVGNTWEYLTVKNYSASVNGGIMGNVNGGGSSDGDVYKYDTIGPNEYGFVGSSSPPALSTTGSPGQGGGYGINLGSYDTVEYSCLTGNAQGGYNGSGVIGDVIANNEITGNGLGLYPDVSGAGGSPHSCGCSGGGKLFLSVNADIVGNYVHDNYNAGIWMDFNNTGTLISHNYVSGNWGEGIFVEASYNTNIADNTVTGNGWAADGAWPAGVGGGACFGGISCTNGFGPVTGAGGGNPYAAIYLPNSGGDSQLSSIAIPPTIAVPGCASSCSTTSRYPGHLYVQRNNLANNFGGVQVYTDTNRYPGNINNDSACSTALGPLNQNNNATYKAQTKVLATTSDTAISGASVTSTAGTKTLCTNYGVATGAQGQQASVVTAPDTGMGVFDQSTGNFLGNVATVTSAQAFTLDRSPGAAYTAGDPLLLSAYGGCGPADYFGGALGTTSGTPAANYWDHCIWGSRNVTVTGNTFSIDAGAVTGCTTGNLCGYQQAVAFNAGVPALLQYWDSYPALIAKASAGLGNVWSGNTYMWAGGGPGAWQFEAGSQGTTVTRTAWQAAPYNQDAGSTFG